MVLIYFSFIKENFSKQKCSQIGKEIAQTAACEVLGVEKSDLVFSVGSKGKPYLSSHPQFHFNISHSHNFVTVAVSDSEIGIDCEKIRSVNLKIAKRYFTEKEQEYINETEPQKNRRFFEIWTKKEAFLKKDGKGISIPLTSFDVTEKNIFTTEKNGFIISVCTEEKPENIKFIEYKNT